MFYVCIAHCMRKSTKCQNVTILVSSCGDCTLFRFLTLHLVGLSTYSVDTQVQLYKALLSL